MGRICSVSMSHPLSTYVILVIITIFAYVEQSQSCHRRVEYVTYYKKQPHKGHGHSHGGGYGHGGGHGGGYGHGGGGHGGGYGHKGYGHNQGHGKGYSHGGGGGHHAGGHGHSQGHGHKGYGQPKGYGHQEGYGGGHQHGGYHGNGHEHGGGHEGGYGGHHEGHEHGGYAGTGGHDQGHHDDGYGQMQGGYGGGHGKGDNSGQKGRRYKYQMYESTHYNDKGNHQTHQPSYGYSHNAPHYAQKGYGYSGPYPNTEYSSPVATSLDAPIGTNSYSDGIDGVRPPPQLDAADTAALIRNSFDTRENEVVQQHDLGNMRGGGGGGRDGVVSNSLPEAVVVVDPSSVGNFDMNLNYNAADLPAPFRRSSFGSPNSGRRRKKISSKFRTDQRDDVNAPLSSGIPYLLDDDEDAASSPSKHILSELAAGPDYLENDAGDVVGANSAGTPENAKLMNF